MSISDAVHSAGVAIQNSVNNVTSHIKNKVNEAKNRESADNGKSTEASDCTDKVELSDKAAEEVDQAKAKSDVDSLRGAMDEADGVEEGETGEEFTVISGTDGDDKIDVQINKDGSCTVTINGEATDYTAEDASRLLIDGGNGDDEINIHQATYRNSHVGIAINGGDGNDVITADDNVRTNLYISGGKGDDTITAGRGNDTIVDNYGSNTIHGGAGNDTITAESRDESSWWQRVLNKFSGNNEAPKQTIYGDDGNDTIRTGDGDDYIYGGKGDDTIYAGKGDDTILGGDGDDSIYAGKGDDTVYGGDGRDYIEGNHGDDTIYGGAGGDIIYAGKGDDSVYGGEGDDYLNGGEGDDLMRGGDGNDIMFGLNGNDDIKGDAGDDVIASGRGRDVVDGGEGADTIRTTKTLFGKDVVNNADDTDDIKTLNPISIPRNFKMNSGEEQRFAEVINDNLEAMACIEPGQEMLTKFAATGKNMYFTEIDEQNCFASAIGDGSTATVTYNDDGTRTVTNGKGTDSYIKINPAFNTMSSPEWGEANTMVLMAHEMSHAYNNAMGNKDYSFYNNDTGERVEMPEGATSQEGFAKRAIRGAEQQAVGIYDDSNIAPNPYGISENDYRAYFHMHLRDAYMRQNADQRQLAEDTGKALSSEYKDYKY